MHVTSSSLSPLIGQSLASKCNASHLGHSIIWGISSKPFFYNNFSLHLIILTFLGSFCLNVRSRVLTPFCIKQTQLWNLYKAWGSYVRIVVLRSFYLELVLLELKNMNVPSNNFAIRFPSLQNFVRNLILSSSIWIIFAWIEE